jgi:hypothetical protein
MPNHCTNLLSCTSGKPIGQVIKPYLTNDGKSIDFEKIIHVPYPVNHIEKIMGLEYDHNAPDNEKLPQAYKDKIKEAFEILADHNQKNFGSRTAYDFHVNNWDTKWNSYSCYTLEDDYNLEDVDSIGFQTAWSPPINVIRQLAKITGECFRMSYYDEGWLFGGEYFVNADGSEVDNCYEDIDDCPEHLKEELDVQYFLDCREEEDED